MIILGLLQTGQDPISTGFINFRFIVVHEYRMALLTSCNFLITGIVILLLSIDKKNISGLAHILILPVLLVTYYAIVSYILGVTTATQLMQTSVAMNTGIAFLGICIIVLSMKPDTWLLKAYTSQQIGGVIARRLLPILMILPIIIGWVRIKGEHLGLFASDKGVVFVAMAYTISFLILIWVTARAVNNIERKRSISEKNLLESREQLKAVFDGVSETLMLLDKNGNILMANNTAKERFDKGKEGICREKSVRLYSGRLSSAPEGSDS